MLFNFAQGLLRAYEFKIIPGFAVFPKCSLPKFEFLSSGKVFLGYYILFFLNAL